jgi:hypothetical protein
MGLFPIARRSSTMRLIIAANIGVPVAHVSYSMTAFKILALGVLTRTGSTCVAKSTLVPKRNIIGDCSHIGVAPAKTIVQARVSSGCPISLIRWIFWISAGKVS